MLEVRGSAKLRFRLLGEAAVDGGDCGIVRISSQKGFALLAYLAMNRGKAVSRTVLADLFWGSRGEGSARQNLRQAIHTLRRDLGPMHSAVLQADDKSISLTAEATEVDALQLEAWAQDADAATRLRCLDIPWAPFLEGFSVDSEAFDEWVRAERHRLDAIATRAFSDLAARLDAGGDGERAIVALEHLIAIDPAEEERHRRLLLLEARYRGSDAALARAKWLVAVLERELDAKPEPATLALIEEIRRSAAPPSHAASLTPPTGLNQSAPVTAIGATPADPATPTVRLLRRHALAAVLVGMIAAGSIFSLLWTQISPSGTGQVADTSWRSPPPLSQDARGKASNTPSGIVAIAVLPFTSYSEQGERPQLVADIITDDLTNALARVGGLRVISRLTSQTFRGQSSDPAAIGSTLGVRYVTEGSVTVRGDLLRINIALIDTRSRMQVWSGRYERAITNRYRIQDEIVASLGRELQIEIISAESAVAGSNPDVHELIFKGFEAIDAANRRGVEALRAAEGFFGRALEREPENPLALAGLAAFHVQMAVQLLSPKANQHLAQAEAILKPLMERAPNLGAVYHLMGLVHVARRQMEPALRAFERVVEINPSHAGAHAQIGRALAALGRPAEGLAHIHYAMRLSPRDPSRGYWFGFAGFAELELRNFDKAIENLLHAETLHPGQPRTQLTLVAAYAVTGRMDEARALLSKVQQAQPHLTHESLLEVLAKPDPTRPVTREGMLRVLRPD